MVTPRVILAIIAAALFSVSESTGDIVAAGGFVFMVELRMSSDFLSGVDDMVKGTRENFRENDYKPDEVLRHQCEHVKRQSVKRQAFKNK